MRTDAGLVRKDNLGDAPQNARLRLGVIAFGVGIFLAMIALELHASRLALAGLFIPFFVGANGIFMGLYRTCTPLAASGLRDLGSGNEKIANPRELRCVRLRALRVTLAALIMAVAATGLLMFATR
jgi:hypothetical protein